MKSLTFVKNKKERNDKLDEIFKNPANDSVFQNFIKAILKIIYSNATNFPNISMEDNNFSKICSFFTDYFHINLTYCTETICNRQVFKSINTPFPLKLFLLVKFDGMKQNDSSKIKFKEIVFFYSKNEMPINSINKIDPFSAYKDPILKEIGKCKFISISSLFQKRFPQYDFIQNELKKLTNISSNQSQKSLLSIYVYLLNELVI